MDLKTKGSIYLAIKTEPKTNKAPIPNVFKISNISGLARFG